MPLYNYTCRDGHTSEARRGIEVEVIPCPACGQDAYRESVYLFSVATSSLPTRGGEVSNTRRARQQFADFQEASHDMDYAYSQREKEVGHPIQAPNYYQIGKARAAKLQKAGVKSLDEIKRP